MMKVNEGTSTNLFSEITAIPPVLQNSYYPSLDGIRGVAIIMVVLAHLNLTSNAVYHILFNGELGVLIFFVLSGFLITTLCIKEKVVSGDISLRSFYIRRVLRIFPVAYLFLAVLIALNLIFKLNIGYINILGAALYLMNFSSYFRRYNFAYQTGHFWSLAVEEQFYLIFPIILKKNQNAFLVVLLGIIFLLPLLITLQYFHLFPSGWIFVAFTHYLIKFQAIAVGCLFSILVFKYSAYINIASSTRLILNVLAFGLILFVRYDNFFSVGNIFAGLLISFLAGYIIVSNIVPGTDLFYKILNTKFLKTTGVLSYSIYIWQQLFTYNDKRLPAFMVTFPTNIICLVIVSCLSYYFYESFFLRLKSKFSRLRKTKTVEIKPDIVQNISV
jgi:peptidoglycan/LPS O-acetylase OafA/YrhL